MGFYSRIMKKRFDNISARAAYEMQQNGAMLVDVRNFEKYETEHAHGAHHISEHEHPDADLKAHLQTPLVLVGDNTAESTSRMRKLSRKGVTGFRVDGGFAEWKRADLPL